VNERITTAMQVAGLIAVFAGVATFSFGAAFVVLGVALVAAGEIR